jgi:hypothetical protein
MRTTLVAVGFLMALATPSAAEINMADSIEWAAADSHAIVVGVVERTTSRGQAWETELRVIETIKGPSRQRVQLRIHHHGRDTPRRWQTDRATLLVFLRADDEGQLAVRGGPSAPGIYDLARPAPAFTADFDVITTGDALMTTTRAAAKRKAARSFQLDVPYDSDAFKTLYSGSAVWLYVPIDAALERRAISWLGDPSLREQGVAALAHFPSPANARRLLPLLSDPTTARVSETGKPTVRRYLVRARVHEVLTAWKIRHAAPVIEEPVP